jgi:hypothetical protein
MWKEIKIDTVIYNGKSTNFVLRYPYKGRNAKIQKCLNDDVFPIYAL